MLGYIAIALSIFSETQADRSPNIFGSDNQSPLEVRNVSEVRCKYDNAKIGYIVPSSGRSKIISGSFNHNFVSQSDIDIINSQIGLRRIDKISWKVCPSSKKDNNPIKFYLETEMPNGKRVIVILLSRDGSLIRE